jgi:hypothetical protein
MEPGELVISKNNKLIASKIKLYWIIKASNFFVRNDTSAPGLCSCSLSPFTSNWIIVNWLFRESIFLEILEIL